MSYGFPEEWQCFVMEDLCEGARGPHGYDPSVYLDRANVELAKLAALGVRIETIDRQDVCVCWTAYCFE